jgi:NAD(P)-dependent dehydrogenase (short-subunit alcohol dehydrogenase family)/enamine deaminase RidA (YjgF/YER057c/UK114 family)
MPVSTDLTGRTAVVTGGATLIGRGVVAALAEAGANVVVADIDEAGGQAVADTLAAALPAGSGKVTFTRTDVTDDAALTALVEGTVAAHGGIDIVVNLAATYLDEGFATSRADWLTALDVNLVSMVALVQAAHGALKASEHAAIVNFTSISSSVAQTGRWVYPASKAAIAQLTRSMAMDLAADGIRVNSVSPGRTWSAIMDGLCPGTTRACGAASRAPTRRWRRCSRAPRRRPRPGPPGAGGRRRPRRARPPSRPRRPRAAPRRRSGRRGCRRTAGRASGTAGARGPSRRCGRREQFRQAFSNVLTTLAEAGGEPGDLVSITIFLTDIPDYQAHGREIGAVWRELAGPVYPAMAGIGTTALWQPEALIEILGVAVIPDERLRVPQA